MPSWIDGLVLFLPMDEGSGDPKDFSSHGNHGTNYGASWVDGKYGKALSFDGVDDYVEIPHSSSLYLDGDFTVVAWATLERTPTVYPGVIDKGRPTINDFWFLSRDTFNQFMWGIGFTDGTLLEQTFPLISLSEWNLYAFGVEGTNMFMSLNGSAKTLLAFTKTRKIDTQRLTLGCNNNLSGFEKVKLDEVRIYNRALSQSEITESMSCAGGGLLDKWWVKKR